jgi:hypothetical protein
MLGNLNWVDFRVTDLDPLDSLVWGITGEKPRDQSHVFVRNQCNGTSGSCCQGTTFT